MARKRRIFSTRIQSQTFLKRTITIILCSLLGLSFPLAIPALSHNNLLTKDRQLREIEIAPTNTNSQIFLSQGEKNKTTDALSLVKEAQQRYNAGQFDEAVKFWQQASEAYEQIGDREGMLKSLINQAQALQNLGSYPRACKTLLKAFSVDIPDCSQEQIQFVISKFAQNSNSLSLNQSIGFRSLGDVLRRQGKLPESKKALEISLAKAKGFPEEGATQLSLGNTERALGNQIRNQWNYEQITEIIASQSKQDALEPYQPAIQAYNQSAKISSALPITNVQAQLNHLSLLLDIRKWWTTETNQRIASWSRVNDFKIIERAEGFLSLLNTELTREISSLQSTIESNLSSLPLNRSTVYAKINLAHNLIQLEQINQVEPILKTALEEARTLKDRETESYALGYLGQSYYKQWQQLDSGTQQSFAGETLLNQATQSTQKALLLAGDTSEVSYLWQSQLGNLLKEQGNIKGAISSYMAAFNSLQSLRTDLNKNNQDLQFDFRQEIKPVYRSLADLLLKSNLSESELESLVVLNPKTTQKISKSNQAKNRLELARTVIESLQLAELDNFFQDPCSEETDVTVQIDDLDNQAAVIYPIIFSDRLEVILSLPKQSLRQITISISEKEFNDTLDRLYDSLYNESLDNSAINIFRTIPLNPTEVKENTQKLLPVLTQLYKWLIEPFESELNSKQVETLVFVLNDRLQRVPMAALYDGQKYLIEKYGVALVPSLQLELINPKQLKQEPLNILAAGVSQQIEVGGQIFPALNKVPEELEQIEANCPSCQKLLNQDFTAETLQNKLQQEQYNVVHLATHGLFSSNPEKTFIIAGNGETINIDKLSQLLSVDKTNIPELLVLSACNTATGDERAVLGLAGVAVRSGARSTIASLWPVGDQFTTYLMEQFYQDLKQPGQKKVNALKNSQLSLINLLHKNPRFESLRNLPSHPYYWAPYVLVGNWQ